MISFESAFVTLTVFTQLLRVSQMQTMMVITVGNSEAKETLDSANELLLMIIAKISAITLLLFRK